MFSASHRRFQYKRKSRQHRKSLSPNLLHLIIQTKILRLAWQNRRRALAGPRTNFQIVYASARDAPPYPDLKELVGLLQNCFSRSFTKFNPE